MKKNLLIILILLSSSASFGQTFDSNYNLNFDNTIGLKHLIIHPSTNKNNLWQVGAPRKPIFTSALSTPNVIATDLKNTYPKNDTSSFILKNVSYGGGFNNNHTVVLGCDYYVNSDTLTDYGKIEFSPDNGITWIDLMADKPYSEYFYWFPKPILSGNSNGWQSLYINVARFGSLFNIQIGDTILFRFSFISDSVDTDKDGLMFDNFFFIDYTEGIDDFKNEHSIFIYPNPTNQQLNFTETLTNITVYNSLGQLVIEEVNSSKAINVENLSPGFYMLRSDEGSGRFVKK